MPVRGHLGGDYPLTVADLDVPMMIVSAMSLSCGVAVVAVQAARAPVALWHPTMRPPPGHRRAMWLPGGNCFR
jgi:hypothetical protein